MNRLLLASIAIVTLAFGAVFLVTQQTARAASITVDSLADTVAEDDACTLREAIQNANDDTDGQPNADCDAGDPAGADTIVFDVPVSSSITIGTQLPPPTQDLTIDGTPHITLEGGDATRFFTLDGPVQLTLIDVSLRNGNANGGGAIVVQNGATLIAELCVFENNVSDGRGGALYVPEGTLQISDTLFNENDAPDGGGGIYLVSGSATITGSTFDGHETASSGAAIAAFDSLVLEDTTIASNNAALNGAGVFAAGPLEIIGGTFEGNEAGEQGGGVWATAFEITGTTFEDNHGVMEGGGLYAGTDDELPPGEEPVSGPSVLTGVTFAGNISARGGGAFINNDATLDDVLVTDNGVFGIVIDGDRTVGITNSSFILNTAGEDNAGGLRIESGAAVAISGSEFTQNSTPSAGGAISNVGTLTVTGSEFDGNEAASFGGAISNAGSLTVEASTFVDNSAGAGGGAIYSEVVDGADPDVSVVDSSFLANTAEDGGALVNTEGIVEVHRSTFSANTVTGNGGAIYNSDVLELVNSTLSGNVAAFDGGGLMNAGAATVLNVTVIGNSGAEGGGIRVTPSASLEVTNTVVAGSTTGGNCAFDEGSPVTGVDGSNISDDDTCPEPLFQQVEDIDVGTLANNGGPTQTHLPADDSPLVEAGDNATCPDVDQRGEERPAGEACDIGSVEVQDPAVTPPPGEFELFVPGLARDVAH